MILDIMTNETRAEYAILQRCKQSNQNDHNIILELENVTINARSHMTYIRVVGVISRETILQ